MLDELQIYSVWPNVAKVLLLVLLFKNSDLYEVTRNVTGALYSVRVIITLEMIV